MSRKQKITFLAVSAFVAGVATAGQNSGTVPAPLKAPPPQNVAPAANSQPNGNNLTQATPPQAPPIVIPAEKLPKGVTPPIPIVEEFTDETVRSSNASVLTAQQIESIKRRATSAKKASSYPYPSQFMPKPVQRTIDITQEPSKEPRMARLLMGSLTTWVFTDNDGNPWFIEDVSFDKELFASPDEQAEKSSNIVSIQPKEPYALGNIRFKLEGRSTPIIMRLSTGYSSTVDDRLDVRVEGKNPAYKPKVVAVKGLPSHDANMSAFLEGLPPREAQRLTVSDNAGQAWLHDGSLYFRTPLTVLSPAFINYAASADGLKIYKFANANPRVLVSSYGKQVFVKIEQ